jgi:hypothetical protein
MVEYQLVSFAIFGCICVSARISGISRWISTIKNCHLTEICTKHHEVNPYLCVMMYRSDAQFPLLCTPTAL